MSDKELPPLSQVDPVKAWEPWEPTAADPWNLKWAGHLYRRAGFGGSPGELGEAVAKGLPATLDRFLKPDRAKLAAWEESRKGYHQLASNSFRIRVWWLYNILTSDYPLQEKMVLFWHNHFATSIAKVQRPLLMYNQNLVLRRNALGNFRRFLLEISHDPAMLIWLDSNSNVKGKPNENYARELMELFSLGVGNYTEKDVREAARAFTGWGSEENDYKFDDTEHDDDPKTVLGQTGNWTGDDIVRIVLEQPVAARFIARKLYAFFISETVVPPDALLEPLAATFRQSDYDIGALVGTILRSRHFFSGYAYRQRIKSPVEFVVGTVRALWQAKSDGGESSVVGQMLITPLEAMGQELFAPPNVKGWPGGKAWLNSATMLARHNFAQNVAAGHVEAAREPDRFNRFVFESADAPNKPPKEAEKPEPARERDCFKIIEKEKISEPRRVVDLLADVLLQDRVAKAPHDKLSAFLAEGKPADTAQRRRVRETAHAIMTMPEYQLA